MNGAKIRQGKWIYVDGGAEYRANHFQVDFVIRIIYDTEKYNIEVRIEPREWKPTEVLFKLESKVGVVPMETIINTLVNNYGIPAPEINL